MDYLEERGYVERRPDPTYRRATTRARKFSTSSITSSRNGWARNGWRNCRRCWPRRQRPFKRADQPYKHYPADPSPGSGTIECCPAGAAPRSQHICVRPIPYVVNSAAGLDTRADFGDLELFEPITM
jgi:hypothetical protein